MKNTALLLFLTLSTVTAFGAPPRDKVHSNGSKNREQASDQLPLILKVPEKVKSVEGLHTWLQELNLPEQQVAIKFGASWCGPCKALVQPLSEFAERNQGRIRVLAVDIDINPQLARLLNPRNVVPAIVTVKNDGESQPDPAKIGYIPGQSSPIENFLLGQD